MSNVLDYLGDDAKALLDHKCTTIPKESITLPSGDFVDTVFINSDRSNKVLQSLAWLYHHGRLGGTGYMSILPVDQGIEHTAGSSFAPNPIYFDPENIVKLAIEGGCNGVASTLGVLGLCSRKYAHKIPFIVKINHNELMTYPNTFDQRLFADVEQAADMGAVGVGATIYFGSDESARQIEEISEQFQRAHELGLLTILWCYTRNNGFKKDGTDYHVAADLTSQANHLGCTIQADIIKQKLPENNGGFNAINFAKTHPDVYSKLSSDNPIDLCRYQVANCYMGKINLINSGGPSGDNDFADAVKTAVVNKRAGGAGLISGRKAFQRPMEDGVKLLNAIQDVYLSDENYYRVRVLYNSKGGYIMYPPFLLFCLQEYNVRIVYMKSLRKRLVFAFTVFLISISAMLMYFELYTRNLKGFNECERIYYSGCLAEPSGYTFLGINFPIKRKGLLGCSKYGSLFQVSGSSNVVKLVEKKCY